MEIIHERDIDEQQRRTFEEEKDEEGGKGRGGRDR